MEIAIPVESKQAENRVALVPRDVKKLVESGHKVFLETGAGAQADFPDSEYLKAGAKITNSAWKHDLVVKVKAQAIDRLKKNQILMAYLHVEKMQSPKLLKKLLDKRVTGYAFEEIRDSNGKRLVNLGYEGGVVGMYKGLRVYGEIIEKNNEENPFKELPEMKKVRKKKAYALLEKLCLKKKPKTVIMGNGHVSRGAQEVLAKAGIKPSILLEKDTVHMEKFLSELDILVNGVLWNPGEAHLVSVKQLELMKKTALIVDISCDEKGAVESCVPTKWSSPTYKTKGITHVCIDNLPAAIPKEASEHLSSMILKFVLKVADGEELETGLMTKEGVFEFGIEKKL